LPLAKRDSLYNTILSFQFCNGDKIFEIKSCFGVIYVNNDEIIPLNVSIERKFVRKYFVYTFNCGTASYRSRIRIHRN